MFIIPEKTGGVNGKKREIPEYAHPFGEKRKNCEISENDLTLWTEYVIILVS